MRIPGLGKGLCVAVTLIVLNEQAAAEAGYLCIADMSTGFKFDQCNEAVANCAFRRLQSSIYREVYGQGHDVE